MEDLIDELLALCWGSESGAARADVWLGTVAENAWESVDADGGRLLVEDDALFSADRGKLRQLLVNLLQNAVDHGPPSTRPRAGAGADVTVRVGQLPAREGFYVADDGTGIPADDRESIFDYGYTTSPTGTGYGLTIVERIASVHGWTVDVTESRHGGARFEIYENFSKRDA